MSKIGIIGLGNTLRRDDGIGVIILESLLKFYKQEGIEYLNYGTASFDLIYRLQNYNTVLLIDGINSSGKLKPGELKIFKLEEARFNLSQAPISTHELNLAGLLELYKKFDLKAKVYVAGIQVKDISHGEELSAELKFRVNEIVKEIEVFIAVIASPAKRGAAISKK